MGALVDTVAGLKPCHGVTGTAYPALKRGVNLLCMTDHLTITDLELWTHIGVPEEERKGEQRLLVTLELIYDAGKVAMEDDVAKGIDYEVLVRDIRVCAKGERRTIERLAEDIASMIREKYHPEQCAITVKKYILPGVREVSITIVRP